MVIIFIRVTADHCYPDWGCLADIFAIWGEKFLTWLGIEFVTIDLSSQSGAFHRLAMANFLSLYTVMGPGQIFLTRVGSVQPFMVWV